ncbi:MAG: type II toxin-antitoxin system VapC family toxin [Chloroflexota bacterium]
MPVRIGLDTSFVIGLLDSKDVWHAPARELHIALAADDFRPYIFDCVLAEVISTLARRTHEKRREADFKALLEQLRKQFPTRSITWLYPDLPRAYDEIINLVESSAGELNFNDALIALSCRDRKIPLLASFDSDFDQVSWVRRIARPADLTIPDGE